MKNLMYLSKSYLLPICLLFLVSFMSCQEEDLGPTVSDKGVSTIDEFSEFTSIIIDGQPTKDLDFAKLKLKNAYSSIFNYIDMELTIFSTEAKYHQVIESKSKWKKFEKVRSSAIIAAKTQGNLADIDKNLRTTGHYETHNYMNLSDGISFQKLHANSYNIGRFVSYIPNYHNTYLSSHSIYSNSSNVYDNPWTGNDYIHNIADPAYDLYLRNHSNQDKLISFISQANYVGSSITLIYPANSTRLLTVSNSYPGGNPPLSSIHSNF